MGKADADKLEFWTKEEYDRFITVIDPGSEDYLIFEILFWTGIREGELLALSLSDFDMNGNRLHINKTYNRIQKRDVIDTPKTENSVRTIDIPNFFERRSTGICEETLWISGKPEIISNRGKNTAETSQKI